VIFHSLEFAAFFIVTVTIYWRLPLAAQNVLLLVASYVFYGWVHPWWPVLLLITTVVDYWSARRIAESVSGSRLPAPSSRKKWLWLSIAANLGLLGVYKYFDFFVGNVAAAVAALGWNIPPIALRLALPAGISFYTFQSMSYTIDVYRGHAPARRSFIDVAAFVSFFPHLVAGPIMRATNLLPQIEQKRTLSSSPAAASRCIKDAIAATPDTVSVVSRASPASWWLSPPKGMWMETTGLTFIWMSVTAARICELAPLSVTDESASSSSCRTLRTQRCEVTSEST